MLLDTSYFYSFNNTEPSQTLSFSEAALNLAGHPLMMFAFGAVAPLAVFAKKEQLQQIARQAFQVLGSLAFVSASIRLSQFRTRNSTAEEIGTLVLLVAAELSVVAAAIKMNAVWSNNTYAARIGKSLRLPLLSTPSVLPANTVDEETPIVEQASSSNHDEQVDDEEEVVGDEEADDQEQIEEPGDEHSILIDFLAEKIDEDELRKQIFALHPNKIQTRIQALQLILANINAKTIKKHRDAAEANDSVNDK